MAPKVLLTTDFDYIPQPVNNNETSVNVSKVNNNPLTVAALNNNLPNKQKYVTPPAPQLAPVKYEQEIFELSEHQWHCHKCRHPIQAGTVAVTRIDPDVPGARSHKLKSPAKPAEPPSL